MAFFVTLPLFRHQRGESEVYKLGRRRLGERTAELENPDLDGIGIAARLESLQILCSEVGSAIRESDEVEAEAVFQRLEVITP